MQRSGFTVGSPKTSHFRGRVTHRRAADLVHATQASCSEPSAAKETPVDGPASVQQQQATDARCSVRQQVQDRRTDFGVDRCCSLALSHAA